MEKMEKLIKSFKEAILLVFLFVLLAMIVIAIILFFLRIQIQIVNLKFCSKSSRHINQDYKIVLKLCAFGAIPIFKMCLTKEKLEKIRLKEKVQDIDFTALEKKFSLDRSFWQIIKKLDISIKNINLHIDVGTQNAVLTSMIVPAISTVIAIILRKKVKKFENQIFIMNPVYQNQNLVNISVSGIFEIKISHIINIIYMFNKKDKKGVKEYERTSHRRSYGYSYE